MPILSQMAFKFPRRFLALKLFHYLVPRAPIIYFQNYPEIRRFELAELLAKAWRCGDGKGELGPEAEVHVKKVPSQDSMDSQLGRETVVLLPIELHWRWLGASAKKLARSLGLCATTRTPFNVMKSETWLRPFMRESFLRLRMSVDGRVRRVTLTSKGTTSGLHILHGRGDLH